MIRIICTKCKNAYLQKNGEELVCPNCNELFPESEENLLSGIQYYNEDNLSEADNCLMKYIVKNGAESRAIFYKALCDGFDFDEDTSSLANVYSKIIHALSEMEADTFIHYLALANDEVEKLEKLVAEAHIKLFETADAEKIKKEVSAIIKLRDEAKAFREQLTKLADEYNENATDKISVNFSTCALVQPELALEVGQRKFDKIAENIASHTVFTGILSTDIKNLEIYYRCIVMFFEKNRQKYDFLLATAGKFEELDKLLEEGSYTALKGVGTIANKLKNAAYDFFQESLRDHDDEFEQQTETVVVIPSMTVAEIPETEEVVETTEVSDDTLTEGNDEASAEETAEMEETETTDEVAEDSDFIYETTENIQETPEPVAEEDIIPEDVTETNDVEDVSEVEETETTDTAKIPETDEKLDTKEITEETAVEEDDAVIDIPLEAIEIGNTDNKAEDTPAAQENLLNAIEQNGTITENDVVDADISEDEAEKPKKRKHKKHIAPIIIILVLLLGIGGFVALKIVPEKLNKDNYAQAEALREDEKYIEAAAIYAELGDFSDAAEKALLCRYNSALVLESEGKYNEAKAVYVALGDYKDSAAKATSCDYNEAIAILEAGKYDEAAEKFKALGNYLDCSIKAEECTYKKALALVDEGKFEDAIELYETIPGYTGTNEAIINAKYAYINANLDSKNKTTLTYLEELIKADYKDCEEIKKKLLGTPEEEKKPDKPAKFVTSINYSKTDATENLAEVTNDKVIYFHVTVNDKSLYGKELSIGYTTAYGYRQYKTITLSAKNNSYSLEYPSTPSVNYTVDFELIHDGTAVASQTVTIK